MILWTSNISLAKDYSIKAGIWMFRDTIRIKFNNNQYYLGFEAGRFGEYFSTSSDQWEIAHSRSRSKYVIFNLRRWSWDETQIYYDGPHCSKSFGWFHFFWSDWDCKKCLEDK